MLDGLVRHLPALGGISFSSLPLSYHFWRSLTPDMVLHDPGFHQSHISLHNLYLETMAEDVAASPKCILRIYGLHSRPISRVIERHSAEMIWPKGSFLKCCKKT